MAERILITAIRCGTVVGLSLVLPIWVTAVTLIILAGASGVAIIRQPYLAIWAIEAVRSILCDSFKPD